MFSQRGKKWVLGLLALTLLVMAVSWLRTAYQERQALAQARLMLNTTDAQARLEAATLILKHEPHHVEAKLVRARELLRLGSFVASRDELSTLPLELTPEQNTQAASLMVQSLINQARSMVHNAPMRSMDTIGGHVSELLSNAASIRQGLSATPEEPHLPQILHAMELDVRAMYLRQLLATMDIQLGQTRTATQTEQIEVLAVQTSDDQAELTRVEAQLQEVCSQVLAKDPQAARPLALMIKGQLRQGDIDSARKTLSLLASRRTVGLDVVLDVASEILELDRKYYLQTSPADVQMLSELLDRVPEADRQNNDARFLEAEIAIFQGRYAHADTLLKQALAHKDYAGHSHGICLRARAMIGLGQAREAEQLLARHNDRTPTWEGLLVQGLATIADRRNELDLLKQAQKLAPNSLPVGLAICQAIIANGGVEVAELDIAQVAQMAPLHTQVIDLRMQLAAWRSQRQIVDEYVNRIFANGLLPVTARDVQLVALMMIDDTAQVEALSGRIIEAHPNHPLAMLGRRWSSLPADRRFEVARYMVQAMRDVVDDDPMRWPAPPSFKALARRTQAKALELLEQTDPQQALRVLHGSDYLPWPFEEVLNLVQAGSERWPADPELPAIKARIALWLGHLPVAQEALQQVPDASRKPIDKAIASYLARDTAGVDAALIAHAASPTGDPTWQLLALLHQLQKRDIMASGVVAQQLLARHPRAEPVLLWIARELHESPDQLDTLISQLRSRVPELIQITESRVKFARDQASGSNRLMSLIGVDVLSDSTLRWQQTELELQSARMRNQPMVGVGLLQTLSLSIPSQSLAMQVYEVDLLVEANRDRNAATILTQALGSNLSPRWLDQFLVRAVEVVDPVRLVQLLDEQLTRRPQEPILHYYRSLLLYRLGQNEQAQQALQAMTKLSPDSPRSLAMQARLAIDQSQLAKAQQLLQQLASKGETSKQLAQRLQVMTAGAVVPQISPSPIPAKEVSQ